MFRREPSRREGKSPPLVKTYRNDLLLRAARGERTPRTPIWLMRQAGRFDPQYRALRDEARLPLEDLFRHPEWSARISLLPQRFGVDAIIFFQDILTPLGPMGAPFVFAPGPVTEYPVRTAADAARLRVYDVAAELPFVAETFRLIHGQLDGALPVLGFAGAPLTLAVFLIEGKSFNRSAELARRFLAEQPRIAHELLDKLTRVTIDYLLWQIDVGAAAVQLFESAAFVLSHAEYKEFALPYQRRIFEALEGKAPTILFARDWDDLDALEASGAGVLSLSSRISIETARNRLGSDRPLQGNLDNHLLAEGPIEAIEQAAKACLRAGGSRGHIFNLSHGLLPNTPPEHVERLIACVKRQE